MQVTIPNKFQERYESLTTREKIIVVTALLAMLWSVWDGVFYQPVAAKQKSLQQQLVNLNTQIESQQRIATELENSGNKDPNADKQKKLADLKAQYSRLQEQVMLGSKKFVPPQLMANALSDMLKQNHQLKLIKLESLPPTTLLEAQQQLQPIYKHGLEITFVGNYADTINYLEALEALPWAIVWDNLEYKVKEYPVAEVTIRVVTLSFDKVWLGV
jgi:MSHA biogenesis protein MshJ